MRQSLALDAKLARDAEQAKREVEREAAEAAEHEAIRAEMSDKPPTLAEVTCARVRGALNRLIWTEAEGDETEYEILSDDLDYRLSEARRRADFAELPIEDLILGLKADMALQGDLKLTPCRAPPPPAPRAPAPAPPDSS